MIDLDVVSFLKGKLTLYDLYILENCYNEKEKEKKLCAGTNCWFIGDVQPKEIIITLFVNANDQLHDIFTKLLKGPRISYL